jgi:hypothetical protein
MGMLTFVDMTARAHRSAIRSPRTGRIRADIGTASPIYRL